MDQHESRVLLVRRMMFVTALFGLFVSTYLLITYLTNAPIACGVSHGCDIVRTSKWAKSFGLPRPLLGVAFYGAILILTILRTAVSEYQTRWAYRLSMLAVTIGFIESAFLTLVQWLDIKAFCMWCVMSAIAATILFVVAWWDRVLTLGAEESAKELKFQLAILIAAMVLGFIGIMLLLTPRTDGALPLLQAPVGE